MEFSRPEYWSRYIFSLFPTQGLNPGLPQCRRILYQLSYQGNKTKRQPTDWEKVLANGVTDKTLSSVQFSHSVFWLCNPMNHSTPGLPVHHQLPESSQTQVHWLSDAIQPSHPLSAPFPHSFNLSGPKNHLSQFIGHTASPVFEESKNVLPDFGIML